jgi:hypothetical protein
MPRRKSDTTGRDGKGGNGGAASPDTSPSGSSGLPVAGAESAAEPRAGLDADTLSGNLSDPVAGTDADGGDTKPDETATGRPATETADTAAGGFGSRDTGPDPAPVSGSSVPGDETPASSVSGDVIPAPDLSGPAEEAAPEPTEPVSSGPLDRVPDLGGDAASGHPPDLQRRTPAGGSMGHSSLDSEPFKSGSSEPSGPSASSAETASVAAAAPDGRARAHDSNDDDDEGGSSVAAWLLGALLLLLLGAALGIWAGPKVASHLPAGMKPVADWLEPGGAEADAEIAALRERIDGMEATLGSVPSSADLDARIGTQIDAAVAPVQSTLSGEVATLRESVGQINAADIRQQLEALSAELNGQSAEFEALKQQLAAAAGQVTGDVNVFKSDVEGLRAEVASLRDQVSGQASRLDEVASSAQERVAAAEQQASEAQEQATTAIDAAEVNAQAAIIRAAVASGAPYADAVTALQSHDVSVPPDLAAGAESGIATLASLRARFPDAAHAAVQASTVASAGDGGVLARAGAFLQSQVASRSLTPTEGTGTDAVLSRMEDKLRNDDLAGALGEAEALPSEAAAAMSDWLTAAKLRVGATNGLATLASSLPATN